MDVVFGGMSFLGPLSFVDTLRTMIPFDGFSDPPFVDISPEGATAGFDLALPNVGVGVFSLENISLGADARIPFLGDALTVGFHFCRKDSPFRLTVLCVGGGGWVELRVSPKGMVLLEVGLEACASLSVDLGVASDRCRSRSASTSGSRRTRGCSRPTSASAARWTCSGSSRPRSPWSCHSPTTSTAASSSVARPSSSRSRCSLLRVRGDRRGAATGRLKGDPTMRDILPPDDGGPDDWAEYCAAFAPLPG